MEVGKLALVSLIAFQAISIIYCLQEYEKPADYIGCFNDDVSDRVFSYSPGDYVADQLTPAQCMVSCGSSFTYAAIRQGKVCLCSSRIPDTFVDEKECNKKCSGATEDSNAKCGGLSAFSVYTIKYRIIGLRYASDATIDVLTQSNFSVSLENGQNATYVFNFGDGYIINSTKSILTNYYDQPGNYFITITASSKISDGESVRQLISVIDRHYDAKLDCPNATVVGHPITCEGTIYRGSVDNVEFDFGDGHSEIMKLGAQYLHLGIRPFVEDRYVNDDLPDGKSFIMFEYSFRQKQKITHWEMFVTKPGIIYIQIYRPTCAQGKAFCLSTQSCQEKSIYCTPNDVHHCVPDQIFTLDLSRCVGLGEKSTDHFTRSSVSNVTYTLVYQLKLNVATVGRHLSSLHPNDQFSTMPSDVLGWTKPNASGGQIRSIRKENGKLSCCILSLNKTGMQFESSQCEAIDSHYYTLTAHYQEPISFIISHNFTLPGRYRIATNISTSELISVDYPIRNVTFKSISVVATNERLLLNVSEHEGTNPVYEWYMGDSDTLITKNKSISYAYKDPGVYNILLNTTNSVSHFATSNHIQVFVRLQGLHFIHEITPVVLGNTTWLSWSLMQGSNVTYLIDFGDGTELISMKADDPNDLKARLSHTFTKLGNYTVKVSASNDITSPLNISGNAVVQEALDGLIFQPHPDAIDGWIFVAVNDSVSFGANFTSDSDYTCSFQFNDTSLPVSLSSTPLIFSHTFTLKGQFKLTGTCENLISSVTTIFKPTIFVENLEAIEGLSMHTKTTLLGSESTFQMDLTKGTVYTCHWDFGDGTSLTTLPSTRGRHVSHQYKKIGNYSVTVECKNRLGQQDTRVFILIGLPVTGLSLICQPLFVRTSNPYHVHASFEEGTKVNLALLVNGEARDLMTSSSDESGGRLVLSFSSERPGVYDIVVNASNYFNEVSTHCDNYIRVQSPVTDFAITSNSPVRLEDGVIQYVVRLPSNGIVPTNATVTWLYGNEEYSETTLTSLMEGQKHEHYFESHGILKTNVTILNEISSVSKLCVVQIQKLVEIDLKITHMWSKVPFELIFSVNKSILLQVTRQANDLYYIFTFEGTVHNSTNGSLITMFSKPGKTTIMAEVFNILGRFNTSRTASFVKPIKDIEVYIKKEIIIGDLSWLEINSTSFGSDTCIYVDMGDGREIVYGSQLITVNCTSNDSSIELISERISIQHEYTHKGIYGLIVTLTNPLGNVSRHIDIDVKGQLCEPPSVEIFQDGNETHPMNVKKSDRLIINSNITSDCYLADEMIIQWSICNKSELFDGICQSSIDLPIQMRFNSTIPLIVSSRFDPLRLDIPELTFPDGQFIVQISVWFISASFDLDGIQSGEELWLHIKPTPLVAKIKGGFSRAVGFELWHNLDASQSFDPDSKIDAIGEGDQLTFDWFCRLDTSKDFPPDYTTVLSTNDSCFVNGSYRLDERNSTIQYRNDKNDSVQIFTGALAQLQSYTFRVVVSKGTRQSFVEQKIKVLPGNPPTMEITCKLNCKSKVNPVERLVIGSRCTDCYYSTRLYYQWDLFKMTAGSELIPIVDLNSKTTTSIFEPNVAINGGVFEEGKVYLLRVSAWKEGGNVDSAGFSVYRFKTNLAPQGGYCDVQPTSGYTLDTKFRIFCQNWQDEDMPLFFLANAVRGNEIINLYKGVSNSAELILPLGKEEDEFRYPIVVAVSDKFGYVTETQFTVQVKEPVAVDINKISNVLQSLTGNGNEQELAQTALAAGSVMNKESGSSKSENAEARTKMINSISQVNACDINSIKQYGDVFKELTAKTDQVSSEAQSSSSDAMSRMSECMLKADPQSSGMESAAKSMFQASANALAVSQLSVKIKNGTNSTSSDLSTSRNETEVSVKNVNSSSSTASKVFDTVDKVGGSLSRQMISGDKPLKISTGNMDVQVGQISDAVDDEDAGFKVPPSTSLLGNNSIQESSNSIGAIKTSMKNSPYDGADGEDLNSEIQGLSLTNSNGEAIDLSGQVIEMFVPRDTSNDIRLDMNTIRSDSRMNVHRFNYSNPNSGFALEIRPIDPKIRFSIYFKEDSRPSTLNYTLNYSIPTLEEAMLLKKLPDPFTYVFSKNQLMTTVEYFVGVRVINTHELYGDIGYLPNMNYTFRVFEMSCKLWNEEEKAWETDGCDVGPKTTFNKTHCVCRLGDIPSKEGETAATDRNSNSTESSAPSFAKLVSNTDSPLFTPAHQPIKRILRQPIKRVSLASSLFPAPNPIDFSKAFAGFANLADNPIAFSVVLSIFGVYLFLLFWARREDRKDIERAGVTVLDDNNPNDRQFFEVTVYTGFSRNAATTSDVYIQFLGEDGETEPRELQDPSRKIFQRRGEDIFLVSCPESIGSLCYLRVWHSNSGKSPAWYLRRISVRDVITEQKYLFINESYLAVEHGSGEVEKLLQVAGPEEITSFNNLFYSTTTKNLSDGHIWFSVFIRPAKSRFTRVQRLSCCLTLLYCTMIANAMFYNVGGESDPSSTLTVGPLSFSLAQIGIGIISSMVVFPVNIIIVTIFRSIEPKPCKRVLTKRRSESWWCLKELFFCCKNRNDEENNFMEIITTVRDESDSGSAKTSANTHCEYIDITTFDANSLNDDEITCKMQSKSMEKSKIKKKKKKSAMRLPYWMKYFAWALLILTSFTSAFFVVLYGFQFGKETSAQFLSSLLISFIQDVLISQPLKILCLGLFIALVIKKPDDDQEEEGGCEKKDDEIFLHELDTKPKRSKKPSKEIIRFQPPSKENIKAAREHRIKEIKMYAVVRDIFIYFFFVISLCIVSYSHLDPSSYAFGKSLEDTFVHGVYGGSKKFHEISSREDVWSWLNTTVVNGLYPTHWYNGMIKEPGFTQDMNANTFSGARLRQLRVQSQSCVLPDAVSDMIHQCHDWYNIFNEDTDHYDPRWLPISNHSLYHPHRSYKSWEYLSSAELDTYPLIGAMGSYSGGGYVSDLGNYPQQSHEIINDLSSLNWLDGRTRALFLEITVYNAQVNLFGIMNLVVESIPTNGYVMFKSIKIARLYTFGGSSQSLVLSCQIFVFLFLFIFFYKESKKMYKEGKKYFRSFWNCVETVMIVLVISTVAIFFSRVMLVKNAVDKIKNNDGEFVSFNKVAAWDSLFVYVSSALVMISCIKFIRILSFNRTISLLSSTLKGCFVPLGAFSIVFLIFFMAYVQWSFIMFVNHLSDYRSFITSMESTMALLLGSYDFHAMASSQRILGPIYFISLMVFGVFYIMNVFLTIIMDTYADVKDDIKKQDNDYEIVDFMIVKWKQLTGFGNDNASVEERKAQTEFMSKTDDVTVVEDDDCYYLNQDILIKLQHLDSSLVNYYTDEYLNDTYLDELIERRQPTNGENKLDEEKDIYRQEIMEELNKWK